MIDATTPAVCRTTPSGHGSGGRAILLIIFQWVTDYISENMVGILTAWVLSAVAVGLRAAPLEPFPRVIHAHSIHSSIPRFGTGGRAPRARLARRLCRRRRRGRRRHRRALDARGDERSLSDQRS